jgi:hypothetical protein
MLLLLALLGSLGHAQAGAVNLLSDPGFEKEPSSPGAWAAYEQGYVRDTDVRRTGWSSARCTNDDASESRGAMVTVQLNQTVASPITVAGWSKADGVSGRADSDYSIYVDLVYADGTPLWGQAAPFSTGTHDWERRQVRIFPAKPVKSASIYALFRKHSGQVWFDDFEAFMYPAGSAFDGQVVDPPQLALGAQSGWFVRDVAKETPITRDYESVGIGLHVDRKADGLETATVADKTGKARAVTVYFVERFDVEHARWWDDVRTSRPAENGELENLTRVTNLGAIGAMSLYPFGCVTGSGRALMLGEPPLEGPRVMRVGYSASAKLMYVAFDLALVPDNVACSDGLGHGTARVSVYRADVDPLWGFRAAAAAYYKRFPDAFDRRAKAEGIWMPFTDPSKVANVADFCVAYHEGDNSVASDDKLGILSFRYTEPMSWWMAMPPSTPRTYDAAVEIAKGILDGDDLEKRKWAQALFNSGTYGSDGTFNVEFQNQPWTNGAVWALNANPYLPCPDGEQTKATLNYTKAMGDALYPARPEDSNTGLDGEYLDSLEGWSDVLDYRPESIRYCPDPPCFATDTRTPVVPLWFSTYEMAAFMRDDLRKRDRLLMANSTPWRIHAFFPLLDVAGTEVNWAQRPDGDAVFNLRRTLSYHKPYLLLQNTDFAAFGLDKLENYMRRSMFYAVYPSMFSSDAATFPYWEVPTWYNAGRPLFKKYIPMIQKLSAAGWEPVTYARTDDPRLYVERYGKAYLTLFNDSDQRIDSMLHVDAAKILGRPADGALLVDAMTGKEIARMVGDAGRLAVSVDPRDCLVIRFDLK